MKMRPLIITEEVRTDILRLRRHAEDNVVSRAALIRKLADPTLAIGNDPAFNCMVPVGYRCVYSMEQQEVGLCRHMSVSVQAVGATPHPAAVEALMKEFGFYGGLKQALYVGTEDLEDGKLAVNVLQLACVTEPAQ